MYILLNLWGEIRELGLRLDMIAFSLIDNVYSLFAKIAGGSIIQDTIIDQILKNIYVVVGIFAFFRLAVLLINSIINPDALSKSGAGLSRIFINMVIMLVLLVFTPTLFDMSRELTSRVVDGNYIQRLFINVNDAEDAEDVEKDYSPGKEMQRIAIGAVIVPEDDFIDYNKKPGTERYKCSGDCEKALRCLDTINGVDGADGDECLNDNGVEWSKLVNYNSVRDKGSDGEKIYVYNYKFLILTVVGWFITYVLLSFTFDVAKRALELAVLEIVSPLFIATMVDPKSMQTGPFHKWLKALGNSYISLFLRIAAISLMLLMVKVLATSPLVVEVGLFGKLIILIAFLIFVKQLPKWFSDMIGIDGDGTGLGSLGIGKKIGGAALIGGLATKAGHGLVGNAVTGLGNARDAIRDNRNRNKKAYSAAGVPKGIGKKARDARKQYYNDPALNDKGYFGKRMALAKKRHEARQDAGVTAGQQVGKVLGGAVIGGIEGFKAGVKADSVKDAAVAGKARIGTVNGQNLGLDTDTALKRLGRNVSSGYDSFTNAVYGDPWQRYENVDALDKQKKFASMYNAAELEKQKGLQTDKLATSVKDIKALGTDNLRDTVAANYANASGYTVKYETDANGTRQLSISDEHGQPVSVDKMLEEGSKILGSTGVARLGMLQNQAAQSALTESNSNAQYMNNLASSIPGMQSALNNLSIPGMSSDGTININNAQLKVGGTGDTIKLDKESIRSLRFASEECGRQMKKEQDAAADPSKTDAERQAAAAKIPAFEQLQASLTQAITMRTQVDGATEQLRKLQERQESLQHLVDSIGTFEVDTSTGGIKEANKTFGSNEERETYLSKQNETLDSIVNPKNDDK